MHVHKSLLAVGLALTGVSAIAINCRMPGIEPDQAALYDFLENAGPFKTNNNVRLHIEGGDWKTLVHRNISVPLLFDPLWRIDQGLEDPRFRNFSSKIFRDNPGLISSKMADYKWPDLAEYRKCYLDRERKKAQITAAAAGKQTIIDGINETDIINAAKPWPVQKGRYPADRLKSDKQRRYEDQKNSEHKRKAKQREKELIEEKERENKAFSKLARAFHKTMETLWGWKNPMPMTKRAPSDPTCLSTKFKELYGNFAGMQMCRDLLHVANTEILIKQRKKDKEPTKICEAVYRGMVTRVYANTFRVKEIIGFSREIAIALDEIKETCHAACMDRFCKIGGSNGLGQARPEFRIHVWSSWRKNQNQGPL